MTPKEEAEELFNQMLNTDLHCMTKFCARQCALIAVNKILHYAKAHGFIELTNHYEEVKQEIELL